MSYFEIGGRLVECAIDVNYATSNMTRKQQRTNKRAVKDVVKTGKRAGKVLTESLSAAQEDRFGFEEAGQLVGLWVGLGFGIATMPVVALDGPLPFADAAWVISTARMTKTAIDVGGQVGEIIDRMLE
ncbi:hypothetical protein OAG22_03365 [Candidatus Poseidoniaceae archaeon]|nr:hypothetical protein [Candidatus Poseidoniaceae archaeon]